MTGSNTPPNDENHGTHSSEIEADKWIHEYVKLRVPISLHGVKSLRNIAPDHWRFKGKTLLAFVNGQTGKAMAQVGDIDPKVGWSGWLALALFVPVLFLAGWIFFLGGSTLVHWYGPALVNYFLTP